MNKIVESLLNDFLTSQTPKQSWTPDVAFEHFSAYLTIGSSLDGSFDTTSCVVGEDSQPAVDAAATIVNGVLVSGEDDIDAYEEINGFLDVDFYLVQAKTSPTFDASALADLGDLAERLFTAGAGRTDNEKVTSFCELKDHIYKKSKAFKRRIPRLHLYYVTTGQAPHTDLHFQQKETLIKRRLDALSLFAEVTIHLVGVLEIQKTALQMSNSLSREITFTRKVALPDIPGITQSYLGVLPAKEFLQLVEGDNQNILPSIFYDNVRDWQGLNEVNAGIQQTLADKVAKTRFVLMNNGVTIIAKKVQPTGEKIVLEDYQVVNGCQTSNVLWQSRLSLDDSVMIPLRVVATNDESVVRDIIKATNSQTEVPQTQLLAVTDFQKQLELFFSAHGANSLFYERRSRQFVNKTIEKSRVVTPVGLIRAFSAMFLEEPHKTARDFGSVLKKVGTDIFNDKHKHDPYFLAALVSFWIEQLIRKGKIDKSLRIARYQVMMAFRLFHEPESLPGFETNKVVKYVGKMLPLVKDSSAAESSFKIPVEVVSKLLRAKDADARTLGFTQLVHKRVLARKAAVGKATK
jgi:hypothetical protein